MLPCSASLGHNLKSCFKFACAVNLERAPLQILTGFFNAQIVLSRLALASRIGPGSNLQTIDIITIITYLG